MHRLPVKVSPDTPADLIPVYQTAGSAGADIMASHDGVIEPGKFALVKTGVFLEIPAGYEVQVRPRSGLAFKQGVTVLNTPGTIDSDYRGEVGVILINFGEKPFSFSRGDRIAQLVVAQVVAAEFAQDGSLSSSKRGAGGFGHTGV